jgi:hypothetical protein
MRTETDYLNANTILFFIASHRPGPMLIFFHLKPPAARILARSIIQASARLTLDRTAQDRKNRFAQSITQQ